jgi:hypothetical protein
VEGEAVPLVARSESLDWIGGHRGRRRDLGQKLAVGAAEAELAIGLAIHPIAFLVHRAVVVAA